MKPIAYLCLETPREGQATYTHVHEIINGLTGQGWRVDLVATERGGASSRTSYWRRGLDYLATQWRLLRSQPAWAAIYMRAHFAALPASLVLYICRKPVIQELNGLPNDIFVTYPGLRWLGSLIHGSYRIQLRLADQVIVVTDGLRDWARNAAGHDRISVVANGANTHLFSPRGSVPAVKEPYVVFVGGITAWHGINVMTAAVSHFAWPQDMKLVIIGDGPERDALRRAVDADASGRLRWLGRVPQEEAATWLRGARAALSITQDRDGHLGTGVAPLKLFEAMASGAPVIVTDLPFQADLVRRERTGIVIPMHDPGALAQAVARMADDAEASRAMGRRGARYVAAEASWSIKAHQTGRIIDAAIARRDHA